MELLTLSIISLFLSFIILKIIHKLIINSNWLRENYRGEKIPTSMGICFIIFILFQTLLLIFLKRAYYFYIINFVFLTVGVGFVGLLDDIFSAKKGGGFKFHIIHSISTRSISSGLLKSLLIFIISFIISTLLSSHIIFVLLNTFLISLFSNFANLLDVKPGRAIKFFLLSTILIITISLIGEHTTKYATIKPITLYLFAPLILFALLYSILYDFKGKGMLGDTGSNLLGASIGYLFATEISYQVNIVIILILIALHILSEFISFSSIIDKIKLLKFFDSLFIRKS